MSKSRVGPEAKIITLFAALPDDSKWIVLDVIRSQSTTQRKASKKSEKAEKGAPALKEVPADKDVKEPLCGVCGNDKDYQDHFRPSPNYHEFDGPKAGRKRKSKADPMLIPPPVEGVEGNGLAAEMES